MQLCARHWCHRNYPGLSNYTLLQGTSPQQFQNKVQIRKRLLCRMEGDNISCLTQQFLHNQLGGERNPAP